MSEPIILYNQAGEMIMVYSRTQADAMLAGGEWLASKTDAGAGAEVTEEAAAAEPAPAVEEPAPPTPAPKAAKRGGRKAKGGDL